MHKKLLLLLLLILPIFANAAEITVSGKVVRILNYEGHQGPLVIMENMTTTANANSFCPRNDYYILPLTHKYFKQNNDLLLAAKLTDKSVSITMDSSPGTCLDGFNKIKHLSIDN
jgi:hypothetical protein